METENVENETRLHPPLNPVNERLFELARAGNVEGFVEEFNSGRVDWFDVQYDVGYEAINGHSIPILQFLNDYYEKPFEIFSGWLNYACEQNTTEEAIWLASHSITPDKDNITTAIRHGNIKLLKVLLDEVDREDWQEADWSKCWDHPETVIEAMYDTLMDSIEPDEKKKCTQLFIAHAAKCQADWFLRKYYPDNFDFTFETILREGCLSIVEEMVHHALETKSANKMILALKWFVHFGYQKTVLLWLELNPSPFPLVVGDTKDQEEDDDNDILTVFLEACRVGMIDVVKKLIPLVLPLDPIDVITVLFGAIRQLAVMQHLNIFWPLASEMDRLLNCAAQCGTADVMDYLLSNRPDKMKPLDHLLAVAVENQNINVIPPLARARSSEERVSLDMMKTAAELRNVPLINMLAAYGGDTVAALYNRALKNDSETAILLLRQTPPESHFEALKLFSASWHSARFADEIQNTGSARKKLVHDLLVSDLFAPLVDLVLQYDKPCTSIR